MLLWVTLCDQERCSDFESKQGFRLLDRVRKRVYFDAERAAVKAAEAEFMEREMKRNQL